MMNINLDEVKESIYGVRIKLLKGDTGELRLQWQDGAVLTMTWTKGVLD